MSTVPGSRFRKTLFWIHLAAGAAAGFLILLMSVTGLLLTYEHQLVEAASKGNRVNVAAGAQPLSVETLATRAREVSPEGARVSLVFDVDPQMPVTVSRGREGSTLLDPYTAAEVQDASTGLREFFRTMENLHRWLGGRPGSTGADLMHAANLLFLFLAVSGIYLWFPAVWRWNTLKGLLLFRSRYINSKFRDFSWHHVFGIWAVIPLLLIALSGVVMSYPWANAAVFAVYGETPPQRGGPPQGAPAAGPREARAHGDAVQVSPRTDLDTLLAAAKAQVPEWQTLSLPMVSRGPTVDVVAELPFAAPRAPRRTVTLASHDASVVKISPPLGQAATQSPGQRLRIWFRFIHTGEQYGVIGQTLAGLASLAACFLVYTGLALAFRRLILPLLRKRD